MTSFFFRNAASVKPPPRPVTSSMLAPVSAARTADEVVVLPMPISPTPRIDTPSFFACAASAIPGGNAGDRLLPCHGRLFVKILRSFAETAVYNLRAVVRKLDAHIDHDQLVSKSFARQDAPVKPRVRLIDCASVTDCGAGLTPSSTTPLSAGKNVDARFLDNIFDSSGDASELDGNILQKPEASGRLCQLCLPFARGVHRACVKGCDLRDCGQKRLFRFHDALFLQKVLRGKPFDRLPACAEFECDGSARAERGKLAEQPRDVHHALIERRVQIADTVVVV